MKADLHLRAQKLVAEARTAHAAQVAAERRTLEQARSGTTSTPTPSVPLSTRHRHGSRRRRRQRPRSRSHAVQATNSANMSCSFSATRAASARSSSGIRKITPRRRRRSRASLNSTRTTSPRAHSPSFVRPCCHQDCLAIRAALRNWRPKAESRLWSARDRDEEHHHLHRRRGVWGAVRRRGDRTLTRQTSPRCTASRPYRGTSSS